MSTEVKKKRLCVYVCVGLSGVLSKVSLTVALKLPFLYCHAALPFAPIFQFFSHLFPVFPIVVSVLLCGFWLADCLKRNPGWAAALSTWGVLHGLLVVVHKNE